MTLRAARSAAALLLLGVPLGSGWLAGFPRGFTELPPQTIYVDPPGYSDPVYAFFTALLIASSALFAAPRYFGFRGSGASDFSAFGWALAPDRGHGFPVRGWIGTALIALSWPIAWTHPDWLGRAADHSFVPLWLGYVLTVDGLAYRRAGTSPMSRFGPAWLAWLPASAAAWWYFELLNRFIQNWIYLGVGEFSALRYVLGSTLAFSTVLPAVLTTAALLSTFGYFRAGFVRPGFGRRPRRAAPWGLVTATGAVGLALMPWFPIALFPLIWIAPLLVLAGLLERAGVATGAGHMLRGDWGPVITLAAAAVICGFFWELWNVWAMPKWTYQIPWVQRFHLFEMPVVGYLGYLPFGTACWAFWLLLTPRAAGPTPSR